MPRRAVRILALGSVAAVLALAAAASATASGHRAPRRTATTVVRSRVNERAQARIVVNSGGYTLYAWGRGTASYGSAHDDPNFPPLIARGRVVAARGSKINGHKLRTVKLSGGQRQVTYYGERLYLYKGDLKPGQSNGEAKQSGTGAWLVVQASDGRPAGPVY